MYVVLVYQVSSYFSHAFTQVALLTYHSLQLLDSLNLLHLFHSHFVFSIHWFHKQANIHNQLNVCSLRLQHELFKLQLVRYRIQDLLTLSMTFQCVRVHSFIIYFYFTISVKASRLIFSVAFHLWPIFVWIWLQHIQLESSSSSSYGPLIPWKLHAVITSQNYTTLDQTIASLIYFQMSFCYLVIPIIY